MGVHRAQVFGHGSLVYFRYKEDFLGDGNCSILIYHFRVLDFVMTTEGKHDAQAKRCPAIFSGILVKPDVIEMMFFYLFKYIFK